MTRRGARIFRQDGFAMIYMAVILTGLLLFSGVAVDTGRAYIVQSQLSKAVDGAALGAARNLNSGNPRDEAARIFKANFPAGYFGTTTVTDPTSDPDFFKLETISATGVNVVTVSAVATLPTTFMGLANIHDVTVRSSGEAQRRMVDLSLVMDVSSSIGWRWPYVRDAARTFVNAFDQSADRLSLVFYGNGANVIDAMPSGRGFNKTKLKNDIPNNLPGGSTAMVEGLYRGWDELRSVPRGQQSGLRVIVLFTDGASNSVPGDWDTTGIAKGLRTWDFPDNGADPDSQTHASPQINGLYDTQSGNPIPSPAFGQAYAWNCNRGKTLTQILSSCVRPEAQWMPPRSFHTHHRSSGIPTQFDLSSNLLKVNGMSQSLRRPFENPNPQNKYPAHVININNAARNLVEIIANAARADTGGDYPIRIYTIGMGELVMYQLGSVPETSASILTRIANDPESQDYNSNQLDGKFYFAQTEADVSAAFGALQNQIIRLSK